MGVFYYGIEEKQTRECVGTIFVLVWHELELSPSAIIIGINYKDGYDTLSL